MRRFLVSTLVYLALFATGSAGLIYQVAWQKYLARLVGNDAIAIAITLALFLSGLSLGYAACGRMSGKSRHPLRMYAFIEALIGCGRCSSRTSSRGLTRWRSTGASRRPGDRRARGCSPGRR
jgi:predicted membrane-bound spermidine synthase